MKMFGKNGDQNIDQAQGLLKEQLEKDWSPVRIVYRAFLQDFGWLPEAVEGTTAGKPGAGKRLEAVRIKLQNAPQGASVKYIVHVADKGWLPAVEDDAVGGTTGESRRAEAVKIRLTGCEGYGVYYRVFMQGKGWSGWCSNGQLAGTTGESRQIEAIEIYME